MQMPACRCNIVLLNLPCCNWQSGHPDPAPLTATAPAAPRMPPPNTHTHARTQVGSAIGAFLRKFNDAVLPFVEGLMPQVGRPAAGVAARGLATLPGVWCQHSHEAMSLTPRPAVRVEHTWKRVCSLAWRRQAHNPQRPSSNPNNPQQL